LQAISLPSRHCAHPCGGAHTRSGLFDCGAGEVRLWCARAILSVRQAGSRGSGSEHRGGRGPAGHPERRGQVPGAGGSASRPRHPRPATLLPVRSTRGASARPCSDIETNQPWLWRYPCSRFARAPAARPARRLTVSARVSRAGPPRAAGISRRSPHSRRPARPCARGAGPALEFSCMTRRMLIDAMHP